MMQLYFKRSSSREMLPKKKTLRFILEYSKSLKIIKTKSNKLVELSLN